ncbi:hypothetical protein [Actinoplanes sp. NPDC020271]|uniref:hypothetical protein n=1 Tax=Actinoplanes sp. NPDC020271 TaxID=3363896 RepID=UPI0037BB577E
MPDFTRWPSFPFEGDMRVKKLAPPVEVEPPRSGEDGSDCVACGTPDDAYIWVSERWRVRAMDRPTGLPMVLILECRSHLDLGDLPNLLAAELGVMTVRLERAIRSLDDVARVHVNRWGDGSAHLHMWFLARPYGRLQLRGTFLSLWDDILPVIPEQKWRENLALVAAWLADFGGRAIAEPAHIEWESPATLNVPGADPATDREDSGRPATLGDIQAGASSADSWVRHSDSPSAGSPPLAGPLADAVAVIPRQHSAPSGFAEEVPTTGPAESAASAAPDAPDRNSVGGGTAEREPSISAAETRGTDQEVVSVPTGPPAADEPTETTLGANGNENSAGTGRGGPAGTGVLSTGAASSAAGAGSEGE